MLLKQMRKKDLNGILQYRCSAAAAEPPARPTGSWSIWGPGFESCSGARFSKVPRTFRARKAICKCTTCLFCKAGLFICCKRNKNNNNCKVSCLETPLFWKYKENYVTRNMPDKFRDLRETGPRPEIFRPFFRYSLSSTQTAKIISIVNSMICSDIWLKYHEWYFKIVSHNFTCS